MKKIIPIFLAALLIASCKTEAPKKGEEKSIAEAKDEPTPTINDYLETAVIYEANIRQYSKEGTFNAFTRDIPKLKQLGVKIIWLMPIFPISETKRKATGDKFASDFPEDERSKYLGSYYAVSDFKKINPEFGTIEDFRKLVKVAHHNGIYVILDWVPNHTGWDHTWIKTNPDFYTKNDKGEITDPLNEDGTPVGWADVADLNYDNPELRKQMIADMSYWLTEENVDGFRCDVAGSVPTTFWKEAIPQLRDKKDIFMLAEAWEPELLEDGLFDMGYGWDRHHTMNHIAKGEKKVAAWDENYAKDTARYQKDDILMTFVTNHDENSWNGTVEERMGDATDVFTVLSYAAPGMPLIYSGQEYGLKHRLKFFEKDSIPKTKGKEWHLLQKLADLKQHNKAFNGGKKSAPYHRIGTSNDNILAFSRKKEGDSFTLVANLSKEAQPFTSELNGTYKDAISGEVLTFSGTKEHTLEPWQYYILVK
ncbi:alpha-amylase family glycosyl hydrolase [Tenacibaculum amylolyticum]|uniref:alpha-amylase family glycosyl hydrolase n=1 Tax=Tenacibaculum amylolyticum TaxID=104269 RepID=UPI0038966853